MRISDWSSDVCSSDLTAGPAGVIWRPPRWRWPSFVVAPPYNGLPATWGNGTQVSFQAPFCGIVDRCWALELDAGGSDAGAPGLRTRYAPDFYAAYCRDPEGTTVRKRDVEGRRGPGRVEI